MNLHDLNLPTFSRPGICEGHEHPDLWHATTQLEQAEAKRICGLCPVQDECLTWAINNNETQGIWGGLTYNERRGYKRRGGRPARRPAVHLTTRTPAGTCGSCGQPSYSPKASYCLACVHGAPAGPQYHRARNEPNCEPCAEAKRVLERARRVARREARQQETAA